MAPLSLSLSLSLHLLHVTKKRGASQRFSEVVSHGPTAIPAKEDVDAAISSVLVDDLGFRRGPPEQQHGGEQVIK